MFYCFKKMSCFTWRSRALFLASVIAATGLGLPAVRAQQVRPPVKVVVYKAPT